MLSDRWPQCCSDNKNSMKERHFSARVAEVGQRNGNTALPPTLSVATSGNGRLPRSGSSDGDGGLGASLALQRRRRRIGGRAWSTLARIIGIKRPICRPMIASPSTT